MALPACGAPAALFSLQLSRMQRTFHAVCLAWFIEVLLRRESIKLSYSFRFVHMATAVALSHWQ
jgi:hypothetical protein